MEIKNLMTLVADRLGVGFAEPFKIGEENETFYVITGLGFHFYEKDVESLKGFKKGDWDIFSFTMKEAIRNPEILIKYTTVEMWTEISDMTASSTLKEVIDDRGISAKTLSWKTQYPLNYVNSILESKDLISVSFAKELEKVLKIDFRFWMNLQNISWEELKGESQ